MIAYVTVGADDISRAKLFYSSFLPELGYILHEKNNGDLSYVLPVKPSLVPTLPDFYVKNPLMDNQLQLGTDQWLHSR